MKTILSRLSALLLAVAGIQSAHAAPGDLDLTFNVTGKVTTAIGSGDDRASRMAIQNDGKIIVTGIYFNGSNEDFATARYNNDGTLDTTFNGTGKVTTAIGTSHDNATGGVVLQGDGKIVVAGQTSGTVQYDFAVVRYTANGALDTTFNTTGKVTTSIGSGDANVTGIALQNDGKILVMGSAVNGGSYDLALIRYNFNGSLDTTFNGTGKVTTAIGAADDVAYGMALQSDGRIVVVGRSFESPNNDFAVVRYNSNGTLDSTFGAGGKTTFSMGADDLARNVMIQADGKIVVSGYMQAGGIGDFALARLNSDGSVDTGFGSNGKVTTPIGSGDDKALSAMLQSDGKIVLAGWSHNGSNYDFALARYNVGGSLDASFGNGGKQTTMIGSGDDVALAMALQTDGKVVLVGYSNNGSNNDFALGRYQADLSHTATFASATDVPLTFKGVTATGQTISLALDYAPATGTNLTVVNNTGLGFIQGTFSNLAQGQVVPLTYAGITYNFVANYYGGSGNDLVLVWKDSRAFAWGNNSNGELGINSTAPSNVPVAASTTGVLADRTVAAIAVGNSYSVALCSDGTVAAWGRNDYGQLGNNSTTQSNVPVAVTSMGVLAGKTVVAIAAGAFHSVALCSDGTVAAWGNNGSGQLGNNSTTESHVPVAVTSSGVLAGKTVVAVAAGAYHSVALCSDGSVAAWGNNYYGQLGNNSTTESSVPVATTSTGLLAGRTVVAVTAGFSHSIALCSDGTVAAWGDNYNGQLGNNSTTASSVPVAVTSTGLLTGKTVVSVSAGEFHSMALCSDGTVAAWGENDSGQLGNNSTTQSNVPLAVSSTGALAGKTVVAVSAGRLHTMGVCSDGTVATWGYNGTGQLGNNSYATSLVPVAAAAGALGAGERFTAGVSGFAHNLALVASPPDTTPPDLNPVTIASNNANPAWAKLGDTVTLSFTANEPIQSPAVTMLGAAATVSNPSGNNWTATATVFPFTMEVTAAFYITAVDMLGNAAPVVTATTDTSIVKVDKGAPGLSLPANITVPTSSATGTAVNFSATATDTFDPAPSVISVPASGSNFPIGTTTVNATATDAAGNSSNGGFTVTVLNSTNAPVFTTAGTVPLTANGFNATGLTVGAMTLGFDPAPGQILTLVNNTSANSIGGAFTDLADGGTILTTYGGRDLLFAANYSGGDGNDLTLTLLNPEIAVEQPLLTDIADGESQGFGTVVLGSTASLVFTIKNTGPGILNGLTITKTGANETEFGVTAAPSAPVNGPAGTTSFTVQFNPATSGVKTAAIHIASDDADENLFDITLTGQALSVNDDTDLDGLNDVAEFNLSTLGYNWQVSQVALVTTLFTNADDAGLFTTSQLQALKPAAPLIARDSASGKFTLTMDWKKSTDLTNFTDFPAPSGSAVSINPSGDIEFEFTSPDPAAFFRIEVE